MTTYPNSAWDGDSGSRNSNDGKQSAPDHQDWTRMIAEIAATQQKAIDDITTGIGETEIVSGVVTHETGNHAAHKTEFILDNVEVTVTDAGANGAHGYVKLYVYPIVHVIVSVGHLVLTSIVAGSGGIANNAALDIGIGHDEVDVTSETLATTRQDITTKADVTLTGGTSTDDTAMNITPAHHDGSSAKLELFLNVAVENASCNADDTLIVSGRITIVWVDCDCS